MNTNRKLLLEKLKDEVLKRIERYNNHQHHIGGALDKNLEDQAFEIQNDDIVDLLNNEAFIELAQINKALSRIELKMGEYCEKCGDQIEPHRLNALPYSTRCKDCLDL